MLKRRMELELRQKDVGKLIGVGNFTIMNWEKGDAQPSIKHYPAIISFLGYEPFPEPVTLGEKIKAYRLRHGVSIKELANELGIDEHSLARREHGQVLIDPNAVNINGIVGKWFNIKQPV
ncbi:helix-turn-helix domain-containing protein [Kordiimonas pumila]|uniref:Helix-turn-helix domain-containing protein n=1 Tax=Kordiimonas pumila TaxID=2161677 RepID=A0ABV7D8P2_9PROT|nr:helix-turn-helix transcriptional regulator [Kordiimonas pumila]